MFERFRAEAVKVVHSAVAEAQRRGDPMIGTDHLLLGVASSASPFGAALLSRFGAGVDDLQEAMARRDVDALAAVGIDLDEQALPVMFGGRRRHLRFTRAAKETLEAALRQAIGMKHRHIGVEHIVLALIGRGAHDEAMRIVERVDVDPAALRAAVIEEMRASA
jgi:ATP-dependent Clp protease ATP-binding subunit ClpA